MALRERENWFGFGLQREVGKKEGEGHRVTNNSVLWSVGTGGPTVTDGHTLLSPNL